MRNQIKDHSHKKPLAKREHDHRRPTLCLSFRADTHGEHDSMSWCLLHGDRLTAVGAMGGDIGLSLRVARTMLRSIGLGALRSAKTNKEIDSAAWVLLTGDPPTDALIGEVIGRSTDGYDSYLRRDHENLESVPAEIVDGLLSDLDDLLIAKSALCREAVAFAVALGYGTVEPTDEPTDKR